MIRRTLLALLFLLSLLALSPVEKAEASGGGYWAYSSYYQPGYTYYNSGYYGGSYYQYGYYRYYPPVIQYVPVYQTYVQPLAFSTYQQGAVTLGTTLTLNATTPVANLQAQPVAPILTGVGVAGQAVQQPQAAGADPCMAKLMTFLDRFDRRLAALEGGKGTPNGEQAKGAAKAINTVLTTNCGKCHEAAVAEKEGSGFVLLKDGQPVALTAKQLLSISKQVRSLKMPKDSKLSDEDGNAILGWLDTIEPQNGK